MNRTADGEFGGEARIKVESVSCLGRCDGAPAALIELHRAGQPEQIRSLERPKTGDPFRAWDASVTFDYMPKQFITFRAEFNRRMANVPYFVGPGGITPQGGNQGAAGKNAAPMASARRPPSAYAPTTIGTTIAASARYIRCSTIICVVSSCRSIGSARMASPPSRIVLTAS